MSIPEDLAFLKSYLTSATFGLSAFLLSGPVILVNLFLHAYVCKKWLNNVRYPRVGSLLRVAALGPVMVAIVGCFVVLESLYPSNNLYISRVVTIRPVLVAQAAAKNLDPSSSRKYFEAIHTLLNTNPENTSNPQLELLLKNDRQSFMVRPTKSIRRPRA